MLETFPGKKKAAGWLALAGDALASIFIPSGCSLCERLLLNASRVPICEHCLASFTAVPERICDVCGQPLESFQPADGERLLCPNCAPRRFAFACARSLMVYQDEVVSAILMLKYQRMEPLAKWFALRLAELARRQDKRFDIDAVVPVPLHPARLRERGFNQADLLAKPVSAALRRPCRLKALQRIRERPEGRVLSVEERWRAVRGAFETRSGAHVDNQRILLVDDVLTTGATLDACARALLDAGAQSVVGLTVARAARSPVTRSSPKSGVLK